MLSSFVIKWLGVPRCLSSVAMYGKGIVELPISSLTEEFNCAKVRLEMTLTQSKDPEVRRVAPTVNTERKWKLKQAVQLNLHLGIGVSWAVFSMGEGGAEGGTQVYPRGVRLLQEKRGKW